VVQHANLPEAKAAVTVSHTTPYMQQLLLLLLSLTGEKHGMW
jgi:hypothetical protein